MKKRLLSFALFVSIVIGLCGCSERSGDMANESINETISKTTEIGTESALQETKTIYKAKEDSTAPEVSGELTVHFIDVGQGDSTLITCGGDAMLIDAGDNSQGTNIQNYLQQENIKKLKYVVCTHPDSDHIGGIDVILYKFDCETIFMTDEENDTATYRDVIDTMENKVYKRTLPVVGEKYELGNAEFTILGPVKSRNDSNNNSIALLLTHGKNTFLFTGDAEEDEETDILNLGLPSEIDVYKAGHHGSKTSSSKELLDTITPKYTVISCGDGNKYGHPHAETLNNLRAMGTQVFRTDEQGTIVAVSDGEGITWNCAPSTSWIAGEPTGTQKETSEAAAEPAAVETTKSETEPETVEVTESETEPAVVEATEAQAVIDVPQAAAEEMNPPSAATYICNVNTKKFHYPTCSSVNQMKESNKLEVNLSRDEVIANGYVPCKRCNP